MYNTYKFVSNPTEHTKTLRVILKKALKRADIFLYRFLDSRKSVFAGFVWRE